MLMVMKPNGEVDVEISPRIIVGPMISLDASSVTDFTYHSAPRSIMTNYDYTQYDAAAAQMEAKAARDDAELEEYGSILDDGGFGIHKSRPVADDEFGATNTPSRQVEEWESVNSKRSVDYSVKSKHSSGIHAMHRRSSDISIKSKRSFGNRKMKIDDFAAAKVNKSSGSNIRRLLFRGKKAKGSINAIKETQTATPDTDASSRQLEPSPFSNNSFTNETQTPLVTNSSVGRRTPSLVEPPFIPISIASPHIAPRKERSILRKIAAMKDDEGSSASTARLTDDDTISEGGTNNSANATREPKETEVVENSDSFRAVDDAAAQKGVQKKIKKNDVEGPDSYCSVDAVNDATQKIFRENVINYNTFFSCPCSGDAATENAVADDEVSVAISSSTPVDETENKSEVVVTISSSTLTPVDETVRKTEIVPSQGATVQPKEGKEAGASGLACINQLDTSKLSYDFYEGSLFDDEESVVIGSARSFDSMDSLIRRDMFACDPCGIGGLMDDVSDAIQDIMRLRKGTSPDSHDDYESNKNQPRRKESFLRYQEQVLSQRRLGYYRWVRD
mmetsp:Transcript_9028/g.18050  ORF Transcript_9028/g.18050 Transcript_9028/m.18050 type:complete len:562 (+) Transcript_9028:231-1916(+)